MRSCAQSVLLNQSVAREGARCTEVEQAFRAPYEPRASGSVGEEDAVLHAERSIDGKPLLNRRLAIEMMA